MHANVGMTGAPPQQTPFHQAESVPSPNNYSNGFGKVKSGQTLADSRDSWRSDSTSWRSGGGNPQTSTTWRTHSGSGWRDTGNQRGAGGHHGHHGNHGNAQVQSMLQMMSLNGDGKGDHSVPTPSSFGPGGGRHGMMMLGPSKATRRYPTETMVRIYKELLYTGRLGLPGGVSRDEPMLFTSAGEFVDVMDQIQGVPNRPKNAYLGRRCWVGVYGEHGRAGTHGEHRKHGDAVQAC